MSYQLIGDYRSSLMPGCAIEKSTFSDEHETGSLTSPYNSQYLGTNFNNLERIDKLSAGAFQENNENLRSNFDTGRKSDNKRYMSKDSNISDNNNKNNNKELDNNKNKFDNYLDEKSGNCSQNIFEKKEKCNEESISSESESMKNLGDSKNQITDIGISTTANSNNMNTIDSFSRDQDIRYTNLNESNPASTSRATPYSVDNIANRNNEYEVQTVHSTSHRPYDPGTGVSNGQTAFERYEPNYISQRQNLYSSYGQSSMGDINSSSKYLLDSQPHSQSQQLMNSVMKVEHDENSGPLYPRPMYQYDPSCTSIPTGFSAMNLSVKITSAQLPYKVSSSTPSPTSTNNGTGNGTAPVIDLSTNSITSTSSNGFENNNYTGRLNRSSPNTNNSQIPSPQGQTLDLSVSRIPHR